MSISIYRFPEFSINMPRFKRKGTNVPKKDVSIFVKKHHPDEI